MATFKYNGLEIEIKKQSKLDYSVCVTGKLFYGRESVTYRALVPKNNYTIDRSRYSILFDALDILKEKGICFI